MKFQHEYKGIKGISAIAKHVGMDASTIFYRMSKNGLTLEQAVEMPAKKRGARIKKAKPQALKKPLDLHPLWALALDVRL
ncbi:hypothetical protein [Vibrio nigripulchritudo]|uniref:hypothetical protein n=1 Tax=Vibrio nigripulchritudo TaxID=28173 RepID=UPI0024909ED2|nr:hypothetical protein [Vibrio nigripulchritudo]BDU38728.1 hypothetical protein TUMSATVNIG2_31970 [Vibrio nigripulchritudo]BDU44448.1 hypothetical protein TUMSATVNIG3_32460 [Vibrio nigripulchritudo]